MTSKLLHAVAYTCSFKCTTVMYYNVINNNSLVYSHCLELTLRSRKSKLRPTERASVTIEQSVLLLDTEPRMFVLGLHHHLLARVSVIRLCIITCDVTHTRTTHAEASQRHCSLSCSVTPLI